MSKDNSVTRRSVGVGLTAALVLTACGTQVARPRWASVPNSGFNQWLSGFRARAQSQGISAAVVSRGLQGAGYIPDVISSDRNQAEFTRTLEDYLANAASDTRIERGVANLVRYADLFARIEARFGIPPQNVCAIWGLESFYGDRRGVVPVMSALATLAYDGRRGRFFERQLVAALRIIEAGDVSPARMRGSWAGAMGHTQFIPSSYLEFAVDFDGDGRRDIWSSDPTDALASAAAYLSSNGWQPGLIWGFEVRQTTGVAQRGARSSFQSSAVWQSAGIRQASGAALPSLPRAALLRPDGDEGPAFLITPNFDVLLRYNNAVSYGLGVGHLSNRLIGGLPIRAAFAPDAFGLRRADRITLQQKLNRAGYDAGQPDGIIGDQTRAAIREFQAKTGRDVTGQPSLEVLDALR